MWGPLDRPETMPDKSVGLNKIYALFPTRSVRCFTHGG